MKNSLAINSSQMQRICEAAATHQINVSLGFSERDGNSVYIAQALIDEKGEIKMKRRKMKPTHMERTIFGDASGTCLADVVSLPEVGRVGGLSCWEHIQPLLKYYTFSQNEEIHVAAWPPLDSFVEGSPGFWSMSVEGKSLPLNKPRHSLFTEPQQVAGARRRHMLLNLNHMCFTAPQSSAKLEPSSWELEVACSWVIQSGAARPSSALTDVS